MRNLPSINYRLTPGLRTNLAPRSSAALGLLTATNVHAHQEFRAVSKIPGSTAVSPDLGGAVDSIGGFEYTATDSLTRQRTAWAIANSALHIFDTTTSWDTPTLPTGATIVDGDVWVSATASNRLFLTGPLQRQLPTGGLKFDGTRATNWGCLAPGSTETILEGFDDNTNWTGSTDATLADDTASRDGNGSIKVTKTGTSSTLFNLTRTTLAHDVSGAGQDAGYLYLYVSSGALQLLEQTAWTSGVDTAAVEIRITADTTGDFTNSDFYVFDIGDLVPEWNLLTWVWSSPSGTTGTGIDTETTNIGSIQVQLKGNSTAAISGDQYFLVDQLYTTDEGAPTAADSGSGTGPDGTYTWLVTYVTEYGLESNAGPASNSLAVSDNAVTLTGVPVSTDKQVIERRIYRDIGGDALFRYVGSLYDNETTTFTDNVSDAALGTAQPPLAGDSVFDNSPPGRLWDVTNKNGRLFAIDADNRKVLKISEPNTPEAWRIVDQLVFEDELNSVEVFGPGIYIQSSDRAYYLTGDGLYHPFNAEVVQETVGTNGVRTTTRAKALVATLHESRLHVFLSAGSEPWPLNLDILDQFQGLSVGDLENAHIVYDPYETRIFVFAKDSGSSTYDRVFMYQFGTGSMSQISGDGPGVDPQDVRQGAWFEVSLPASINPVCSAVVERTADLPEVWFGAGNRVFFFDPTATTWATAASTENITMTAETQWAPTGGEGRDASGVTLGKPRYLRLQQSASGAVSWTITISMARDAEVDNTSPITVSWSPTITGNESVILPVPLQGAGRGEWMKVKLATSTADASLTVRDLELFYIPTMVDFRGPRT